MPTPLDLSLRPAVASILAGVGVSLTFTVDTGAYNAATGERAAGSTSYVVTASPPLAYTTRHIDGDLIRDGDLQLFVAATAAEAAGLTLKPGVAVTIGSAVWRVVRVVEHYSGQLVAAFELTLRR